MLREFSKIASQLTQILDIILILSGFYFTTLLYERKNVLIDALPFSYQLLLITYMLIWVLLTNANELYESRRHHTGWYELTKMIRIHLFDAAFTLMVIQLYNPRQINNRFSFYFVAISTALTLASHFGIRFTLNILRRSGYNRKYVLIVGSSQAAEEFVKKLQLKPESGYSLIGYVSDQSNVDIGIPQLGRINDIQSILKENVIDLVIYTIAPDSEQNRDALDLFRATGKSVVHYTDEISTLKLKAKTIDIMGITAITYDANSIKGWPLLIKNLMDILGSLLLLVFFSPIMIIIAILVKFTSQGPVLFVQNRVGLNGRIFKMYKFRSMVNDAEAQKETLFHLNEMDGPVFKIKNDPRITPVGRFIRKTSLDELPQLINVLKFEMSLVGPRPAVPSEVNMYDPVQRKRLSVKPGLTCIWQVNGRNDIDFEQWMRMDAEYIDTWNLWLDVKLILKTGLVFYKNDSAS